MQYSTGAGDREWSIVEVNTKCTCNVLKVIHERRLAPHDDYHHKMAYCTVQNQCQRSASGPPSDIKISVALYLWLQPSLWWGAVLNCSPLMRVLQDSSNTNKTQCQIICVKI